MSLSNDLRASREILSNLTMREVRGKYKRSFLGQTWSLLNPIASLAIYTVVFGLVLKATPPPGEPSGIDNFTLWLACALLPWNFFATTMHGGMNALLGNSNLVQKVYFPRYTLVVSNMLAGLVTFGFELLVLAGIAVVFGSKIWIWIRSCHCFRGDAGAFRPGPRVDALDFQRLFPGYRTICRHRYAGVVLRHADRVSGHPVAATQAQWEAKGRMISR